MIVNAVTEVLSEFEISVIGITIFDGVPEGIIFYREGKLVAAELSDETRSGVPAKKSKNPVGSTINAPEGMKAVVSEIKFTRNNVKDFQVSRDTIIYYKVTELSYRY
ncbi:MAG: hypothetical protein RBR05_04560 [Candidatus Methanomethylophilaceae archaeon]|nr:hypothetical protein [Candidatus Methanomethylophilaceae archaeon]MDD3379018.1 hypothetical protein [Candidatus Methanomethylophilaceae archaeon]MDY0224649.1 hypothetical protein [Candidatus Methanomethylophilaceae archaeon]